MKKKVLAAMSVLLSMSLLAAGCGSTDSTGGSDSAAAGSEAEAEVSAEAEAEEEEEVVSVAEIDYTNINYDFSEDIAEERAAIQIVPDAADIDLSVADENGATGVVLSASVDETNTTDYYLNAMVAGNALVFTSENSGIASASSSVSGDLAVEDGAVTVVPSAMVVAEATDEVFTFTLEDGTTYNVHTWNELLPYFEVTGDGVSEDNAGVYSFAIDKFMLRVNTDGELVYYRNMNCVGEEIMAENFATQETADGTYYTTFVELRPEYRNSNGGFSSGFYLVMDANYADADEVTLLANTEENHTHGQGYLDQHEFVVLGANHYLTLSYTPQLVENLPDGVEGLDGGNTAYVWAGVFQEIQDGEVLNEICTTDYPMLYESAVEKIDYANSTDEGTYVTINNEEVFSTGDGWMDYVHPNSLDYTLDADGNIDKLLVSMRDQCAVYQFDFSTGAMEWILGGKASTITGYEDYTSTRTDDNGEEFTALTYAQHYARYTNKNEDGTLTEDPIISIFDNQTGTAPFITVVDPPTLTRTLKVAIDEDAQTAVVSDVINGTDLNEKSEKYHIASHCGSVDYFNSTSVVIGWGLHGVIDNLGAYVPEGTITDAGYDDLRQGSRPVFTEYDMENDSITFELSVTRNVNITSSEAMFSYRTYKTAE
ncbi:MAG: aryl-sulfate sulfotransferase [Clostridiales bacterium]|nr:aryl-sulfate sulfotransferase [Clostridiales bacterium]